MYQANLKSKNKRSSRGCLLLGILFLALPFLCLGMIAVGFLARESSAKNELNARLDKIAAEGLPVDSSSIQKYAVDLTSTDRTDLWLEIHSILQSEEFVQSAKSFDLEIGGNESEVPPSGAWEKEDSIRAFLLQWDSLHGDATQLACEQLAPEAIPVRFPIEWKGLATLLPHTQNMRDVARMIHLVGQVAIRDRNSKETRLAIESLIGCSKVLEGEPIQISQLVAMSIDSLAMKLLQSAVQYNVLNEDDLLRLLPLLEEGTSIGSGWERAMSGERAMMLPVFEDASMVQDLGPSSLPFRSRDALHYLDHIQGVLEQPTDDIDTFLAGLSEQDAELQTLLSSGILTKLDSVLTGMLAPAARAMGEAFVNQATRRRLATLAVAIRLHEQRHRTLPNSLNELSPLGVDANTLKPAGGKPFGYRLDETGATIWGFELRLQASTPPSPPNVGPGDPNSEAQLNWIWKIPASEAIEAPPKTP